MTQETNETKERAGWLDEAPGQRSMSRALALMVASAAMLVVVVGLWRNEVDDVLVLQLLGWVVALKHGGRVLEDKKGGA